MRAKSHALGGPVLALILAMPAATNAKTIHVEITDLAFMPAEISARIGDTVEWDSTDFVLHTATARGKEWDVRIPAHGTGSVVLKSQGAIDYYCRFHPNMKGTITVRD